MVVAALIATPPLLPQAQLLCRDTISLEVVTSESLHELKPQLEEEQATSCPAVLLLPAGCVH